MRLGFRSIIGLIAVVLFPGAVVAQDHDMAIGSPDAPVTIIEYASMSCPHCASFHNERLPWLKKTYLDTGKARLVFRDFPLNAPALSGAMLAHCAGPERFFGVVEMLFRRQKDWAFGDNHKADLAAVAKPLGIGQEEFDRCLADEALKKKIVESRMAAMNAHELKSTPSFIIDGKVHAGVLSEETLTNLIEAAAK